MIGVLVVSEVKCQNVNKYKSTIVFVLGTRQGEKGWKCNAKIKYTEVRIYVGMRAKIRVCCSIDSITYCNRSNGKRAPKSLFARTNLRHSIVSS